MESADETPPRHLSLIPYPYESGEVVLRRGNSVVVYDSRSRQLSVRNASNQALELLDCPYCHRPMRDGYNHGTGTNAGETGSSPTGSHAFDGKQAFMDPNYFRMLAASQRPSPNSSNGPATPVREGGHPTLRSGRSRDVSGNSNPPSGAEFIGSEPQTSESQGISDNAFSQGFFKNFFREVRELGRGGNGVVLLVEHILDGFSIGMFACKRIPVGNNHVWLEKVLVEVRLLQKIPHPNLVAYHWVWIEMYQPTKFGPSVPCLWILQEFCNGGDLQSYILGPPQSDSDPAERLKQQMRRLSKGDMDKPRDLQGSSRLTFEEIFSFFRDITSGLHHLHSKGYIHRDLKPSNCLMKYDGNMAKVLISDFGEVQAAGTRRGSTGATGTISYCAPEVLRRDPSGGAFGDFTTKSDIFSLGMIVYFMCFGRLPYVNADGINEETEDVNELRSEISRWSGFDDETRARTDLPEKLYRYLKRLLSVDPNERPSTGELLASIKAGANGDSIFPEDFGHSRVSSIDSPRIRPSMAGKQQRASYNKTEYVPMSREPSTRSGRTASPPSRRPGSHRSQDSLSRDRPTSPLDSSVVLRPRKIELPNASISTPSSSPSPSLSSDGRPPQSPRLLLPPPTEPSIAERLVQFTSLERTQELIRVTIFTLKMISLMLPCTPYAVDARVFYPLLALAGVDFGIMPLGLRRTLLLSSIHAAIFTIAQRNNRLCQGRIWMHEAGLPYL